MRTFFFLAFALAATDFMLAPAYGQTAPPSGGAGASNAGMQIANNGAPNGVTACAGCHGAKGEGNASAGFPRLAGQSPIYLVRQLASYANGSRNNAVMMPIAKGLNRQQIEAVAAYYASLNTPSSPPAAAAPAAQMKRGETLATVGDNRLGVQGCANCHGPGGAGEPPTYPYLAGQHGPYLITALGEWKNGARNTDPSQQMTMIAKRLSDSDITALAAYYAAQPAPAAQRISIPADSIARPAAGTTPQGTQAGSTPTQGVGSEQGAVTSGGGQGAGGGGAASGSGPSGSPTGEAR